MYKFVKAVLAVALITTLMGGCTELIPGLGSKPTVIESETSAKKAIDTISKEEDERIKNLINDYFSSLYSVPAENYYTYCTTGTIPAKIRDFISKSTISLAEGNREIGIHMPRFVEINGLTAIRYEIITEKVDDGTKYAGIEPGFAGNIGDSTFYYVKLNLYAKCMDSGILNTFYTLNATDNTWKKKDGASFNEALADTVRVQARYDVEVRKEDGSYKIATVKEASTKDSLKNRLYIYNNDFMSRFPYINNTKTADGKAYVKEADGKMYEEEKAVIKSFFSSLKNSLNRENMKLLYPVWTVGSANFKSFLDKIAQPGEGGNKKFNELVEIKEDYRTRFDYGSLPLQLNMERLEGDFKSFEVVPHPGYTKKQITYIVTFKASVIKANGFIEGEECVYKFDYFVTLAKSNEVLKVNGIKLKECSKVEANAS
jgi:hypothetical protein